MPHRPWDGARVLLQRGLAINTISALRPAPIGNRPLGAISPLTFVLGGCGTSGEQSHYEAATTLMCLGRARMSVQNIPEENWLRPEPSRTAAVQLRDGSAGGRSALLLSVAVRCAGGGETLAGRIA